MLPDQPAQMKTDFLTELLQAAGVLQQASVVGKVSFNAQLSRLHLIYDHREAGAPKALIAKAPTVNIALAAFAAALQPSAKWNIQP